MSSYLNIGSGGPEAAVSMALKVKTAGDDFVQTARGHADRIQELEAGAPWGSDEFGQAFYKNYTGQPADGSPLPEGALPVNEALRTSLHDAGTTLSDLGAIAVEGMAKYSAIEAANASDINSAGTTT